jgi:hypothetical protein
MELHFHRDGEYYGPFSVEEAREMLTSGDLSPDDLTWHDGATEWLPAQQVIEAAEAAQTTDAVETPAIPEPEPADDHQAAAQHHFVPEPKPESAPNPTRAPARSGTPSWVPPRRDGMDGPKTSFF